MGHGIAQTFAVAGCEVRGWDVDSGIREQAPQHIRNSLDAMASAGLLLSGQIDDGLSRIQVVETLEEAVTSADFVVEAVAA